MLPELSEILNLLPSSIREQVFGYVQSVQASFKDIAAQASVEPRKDLQNKLLLVAAIRKLHAVISSRYWLLNTSQRLLDNYDIAAIKLGGAFVGPQSNFNIELEMLLRDIESTFDTLGFNQYLQGSYEDVLTGLDSDEIG